MGTQVNRTATLNDFYTAPDQALYDEIAIAHVVGVTVAKLQRDRWAGTGVPFIKIGRSVRYRKAEVLAWLNQFQPQQSTSQTKNQAA
jgi:hypothetical protein